MPSTFEKEFVEVANYQVRSKTQRDSAHIAQRTKQSSREDFDPFAIHTSAKDDTLDEKV